MQMDDKIQPDWARAIDRFHEYVRNECEYEIVDLGDAEQHIPATRRPFMPNDKIRNYFTEQDHHELRSIISALPLDATPIHPHEIVPKYSSVFCTLLSIGKGAYIEHFRHYDNLSDLALPFDPDSPPANLPEAARRPEFLRCFCEAQWKFCVASFDYPVADKHYERERILPIIEKTRLAGGGTANLWLIKIHSSYNNLSREKTMSVCYCRCLPLILSALM